MKIVEKSIGNQRTISEISILAGLGARGRLGDAPGRVWNGLGTPSWAVLAAKLAVLAALLDVRGANLAISSAKWVLLGCSQALVKRVACASPSPSSVRSEFLPDVGILATSPKLEIRAPTQCFVRVRRSCRSVHTRSDKRRRNCRFGLENRASERPGSVPRAPGRAKSGGKMQISAPSDCLSHFFLPVDRAGRNAEPSAASREPSAGGSARDPV